MAWTALWSGRVDGGVVFPEIDGSVEKELKPALKLPPDWHIRTARPPVSSPWARLFREHHDDAINAVAPSLLHLHPEVSRDVNSMKGRDGRPCVPSEIDRGMMLDAWRLEMSAPQFYGGRKTLQPPREWQIQTTPPPASSP
jgi:hypothetical protein